MVIQHKDLDECLSIILNPHWVSMKCRLGMSVDGILIDADKKLVFTVNSRLLSLAKVVGSKTIEWHGYSLDPKNSVKDINELFKYFKECGIKTIVTKIHKDAPATKNFIEKRLGFVLYGNKHILKIGGF